MINYFIGVGGTGARILESLIRLCECGHVSAEKIKCVMVDADNQNGNAAKTSNLITNLTVKSFKKKPPQASKYGILSLG